MKTEATILKTLKVRIKDKHAPLLKQWAFECNQVWNEANAITADYSYEGGMDADDPSGTVGVARGTRGSSASDIPRRF